MPQRQPIFNVPWPVLAIIGLCVAIHVARQLISEADANWLVIALAFIPARYSDTTGEIPGDPLAQVTSFVTHLFVHGDATHLAINGAWLLAFGAVVCRRIGAARFIAFFLAGGVAGALAFLVMHPGQPIPVVGASGAVAALMGAVMRFMFVALDWRQGYLLREDPAAIPLMPLATALTDRRVIAVSVIFLAINLLAIIGFGTMGSASAIAWEAHLGGYAFGLLAFGWFDSAAQNPSPTSFEFD